MKLFKRLALLAVAIFSFNYVNGQLCYSEQTKESEKGFLGQVNGINIFYEIWYANGAAGTCTYSVILRTDTIDLSNSLNFCIDENGADNNDSISVSIYKPDTVTKEFKTTNGKDIPSVFQILVPRQYGYFYYRNFNKPNSLTKFYLKGDKLFLTYTQHQRYDNYTSIISETYELRNGNFIMTKTRSKMVRD